MSVDLTVAIFNLGFHCQDLKPAGTEKKTVLRLRKAHAPKWGANSAEFMASLKVDLLGTQEMLSSTKFLEKMNASGLEYKCHKSGVVAIFYRSSTLGYVEHLHGVKGHRNVRGVVAIYVPRFELVFLSVWLDHHSGKVEALKSIDPSLKHALGIRKVSRVIWGGDTNDYCGHGLYKKTVKLAGVETHLSGKLVHTCTEPSHFKGVGDMIFDSASGTTKKHGIPTLPHGWGPYTQLMSDHLPVYAVKEFREASSQVAPNKRKLDAESGGEADSRARSPSLGSKEVALWDDVDHIISDFRHEYGLRCCKRARRE